MPSSDTPAPKAPPQLGWEEIDAPLEDGKLAASWLPSEVAMGPRAKPGAPADGPCRTWTTVRRNQFVAATEMAGVAAASTCWKLAFPAQGYLPASFISPLNQQAHG